MANNWVNFCLWRMSTSKIYAKVLKVIIKGHNKSHNKTQIGNHTFRVDLNGRCGPAAPEVPKREFRSAQFWPPNISKLVHPSALLVTVEVE